MQIIKNPKDISTLEWGLHRQNDRRKSKSLSLIRWFSTDWKKNWVFVGRRNRTHDYGIHTIKIMVIESHIYSSTYSSIQIWKSPLCHHRVEQAARSHLQLAYWWNFPIETQQLKEKHQIFCLIFGREIFSGAQCLTFETVKTYFCLQSRHLSSAQL